MGGSRPGHSWSTLIVDDTRTGVVRYGPSRTDHGGVSHRVTINQGSSAFSANGAESVELADHTREALSTHRELGSNAMTSEK